MAYNIIVSPRAQNEIENAIDFYALNSIDAPSNFISSLEKAYGVLEVNPFFRIMYRNIRALKINGFPFSLYFIINDDLKIVRVLSCFHNKRNPGKRPEIK